MKATYHFNSFNERRMLAAISNLILYYNDVTMNLRDKFKMLEKESRVRDMLVAHLRKGTGNIGITVDNVFTVMEAAVAAGDVFWFEVDGVRFCDMLRNKTELDITFHMQENYFLTQSALTQFFPTKNWLLKKFPKGIEGEKERWLDWLDMNWKHDRKIMNPDFTRKVEDD
jgi:hypothetical protein